MGCGLAAKVELVTGSFIRYLYPSWTMSLTEYIRGLTPQTELGNAVAGAKKAAQLLIVEDDPTVACVLATTASMRGYGIILVEPNREGALLHLGQADLLITDGSYPLCAGEKISTTAGVELVQTAVRQYSLAPTRIVMYSGDAPADMSNILLAAEIPTDPVQKDEENRTYQLPPWVTGVAIIIKPDVALVFSRLERILTTEIKNRLTELCLTRPTPDISAGA